MVDRGALMNKNRTNAPKKYILIDFNCANEHTHHWSSVFSYAKIINTENHILEIWLPRYVSSNISEKLSQFGVIRKVLRSPQYGSENFFSSPTSFLLSKATNLIFRYIPKNNFAHVLIHKLFVWLYLYGLLKKVINEDKHTEIHIVFPTLDLLSLKLIEILTAALPEIDLYARRMGAETKGPLSTGNELIELTKLLNSEQAKHLRIGIPTLNLYKSLKRVLTYPERLFWSPLPPSIKINTSIPLQDYSRTKIGFPGTAKASKGFDSIPYIIKDLIPESSNIDVLIQKTKHPWNNYAESRENIFASRANVYEFDSVLNIVEYEKLLDSCDLIFLPYLSQYYKDADSGILYEAADREIPIVCNEGLGFSEEAFMFGIGINLKTLKTIKDLSQIANSPEIRNNIKKYNNLRKDTIIEFLNLSM